EADINAPTPIPSRRGIVITSVAFIDDDRSCLFAIEQVIDPRIAIDTPRPTAPHIARMDARKNIRGGCLGLAVVDLDTAEESRVSTRSEALLRHPVEAGVKCMAGDAGNTISRA